MKKLLIIAVCLLIGSPVFADFTVYYDKDSNEVKAIVEKGRYNISEAEKDQIKSKVFTGSMKRFALTESHTDYILRGNNFIINTKRISDRVNARLNAEATTAQKSVDQESAKVKLMALGLTEAEFNALIE